jgi:hypothetical protein
VVDETGVEMVEVLLLLLVCERGRMVWAAWPRAAARGVAEKSLEGLELVEVVVAEVVVEEEGGIGGRGGCGGGGEERGLMA